MNMYYPQSHSTYPPQLQQEQQQQQQQQQQPFYETKWRESGTRGLKRTSEQISFEPLAYTTDENITLYPPSPSLKRSRIDAPNGQHSSSPPNHEVWPQPTEPYVTYSSAPTPDFLSASEADCRKRSCNSFDAVPSGPVICDVESGETLQSWNVECDPRKCRRLSAHAPSISGEETSPSDMNPQNESVEDVEMECFVDDSNATSQYTPTNTSNSFEIREREKGNLGWLIRRPPTPTSPRLEVLAQYPRYKTPDEICIEPKEQATNEEHEEGPGAMVLYKPRSAINFQDFERFTENVRRMEID